MRYILTTGKIDNSRHWGRGLTRHKARFGGLDGPQLECHICADQSSRFELRRGILFGGALMPAPSRHNSPDRL